MKITTLTLALLALPVAHALAADATYRDMTPFLDYGKSPKASDDAKHTNTWQYWKDNKNLDTKRVNDLTEFWTVNWKYREAPYDDSLHGGHEAQDRGETL